MKLKHILALMMAVAMMMLTVGCAENRVTRDEAKETTQSFLTAVSQGDFERARSYMHPQWLGNLEGYFNGKETALGIDFQKGIEVTKYTNFSSALYDSDVDGSEYELEAWLTVDGAPLELEIEIVRNDQGYGIYTLEIDTD